ncbi:cytochrome bc1 complex Rieske iron-sulfur subunit [Thermopolyspora flexuosa]|jgi:ubiquinol-cytochrome c reductase iron-sulfur subunit|uniref:Cytochrome bc1 complex Rieske iron-sulfur subunit n=1 Tax=Thermopolyspora flexuosa TaxID=103836 RepID=A0A543IZZ7_9ACTN|nr:Rieske 2Fe-2S domain-containing protein [Thermopolyspora flexuosa]PZN14650.1 MAG: (2Fe-2S)-binding protein [Mycolicibacterium hassiacum]TQM76140.1 menaquinol-cytochrome c reductase iron-sulfur subunit precursor [Thermopolyspora flexuosa]GGM65017.1 cytochrome bc1 complex Rieske iron-sulfur subunit [Thermopolyspora flexuosa]
MSERENTGTPEERVPHRVIGTPQPGASTGVATAGEPDTPATLDGGVRELEPGTGIIYPDPASARRAERLVALLFLVAFLAGVGFIVSYVAFQVGDIDRTAVSNLALGGTMTVAFLALAIGLVVWVRRIMPKYNLVQERHPMASEPEVREEVSRVFAQGAEESGFLKHKLLRRTLLLAAAPLGLAPLVLLKDLGPLPEDKLRHTVWRKGMRLVVEGTGQPIRAADFNSPGGILSVVPEGYEHDLNALAKATLILIKLRPEQFKSGTNLNWTHDGIVAYSKICTHVGCPAALYEQTTNHILCPCHQSTFDAADGAKVVFGPAARPLPQLPITVDSEGYLVAQGDFQVPVGPSFWERGDAEAEVRGNA